MAAPATTKTGHALGLGHQGAYNNTATHGVDNVYVNDTWQYSVMSYFSQDNYNGGTYDYVITPQMADIYAMQSLYGAATTRTGNTTYGFNSNAGSLYDFNSYAGTPAFTIYDSGGYDTLDASGYSMDQTIDLTPGGFSSIGGYKNNIGISTTTTLEYAYGGSGSDKLTGNEANNYLSGGNGADDLKGAGGSDTLVGGNGNDSLKGGGGDDYLYGGTGINSATFIGDRSEYTLTHTQGGLIVDGANGHDTLHQVQRLVFDDVAIVDLTLQTNQWMQAGELLKYMAGTGATHYQLWDSGTAANSGLIWTPAGGNGPADTAITVAAADVDNVWLRGGQVGGAETMWVRSYNGSWTDWQTFTLNTLPNHAPVATINDHAVLTNAWTQVRNWLSYSDSDGNAAVKYQFWDSGTGANSGYFWTPSDTHHAANTTIEVAASDLANVWVRGGATPGSDTMWVRAFDGTDWGAWDSFTFTTKNTAPVATIDNHSVQTNEWVHVKDWLTFSDYDGQSPTQYQFWDGGTAANSGYFRTPDNAHQPAATAITVAASALDGVLVRGGTVGQTESMYVRAFDGTDWGAWDLFNFTTLANHAPVAAVGDHSLHTNEWAQVTNWLSYADTDGNAATKYQFWDGGTGANSGYFWTSANAHHPASTAIEVAAADLANVWVRGGAATGAENMYVRAFDGTNWGAWDSFQLHTIV